MYYRVAGEPFLELLYERALHHPPGLQGLLDEGEVALVEDGLAAEGGADGQGGHVGGERALQPREGGGAAAARQLEQHLDERISLEAGVRYETQTGTSMVHIPYKGSGDAIRDVLSGQVQVFMTTPPSVMGHIQAGKLKGLAVTSKARHPNVPQVPTTAEAGLTGFELEAWVAIFAPAGTPPDVINKLTTSIQQALDLPETKTRAAAAGIDVVESDISVAGRILGEFPDFLSDAQKVPNTLSELGRKTLQPDANIIKLPNISASQNQLVAAIRELRARGFMVPEYPENPKTDEEKAIRQRYAKVLGSAVNPVLREGNSDRRAPRAVKEFARKHPHSMGQWSQASRTHVSHMVGGDFYAGEKSMTVDRARDVKMELVTKSGKTLVLKPKVSLLAGEIIDSMFMSKKALLAFYEKQIEDAKNTGVMFSLHVKATMMKVSHPIVFGHCVRMFYKEAFEKHGALFDSLGDKLKAAGLTTGDLRVKRSRVGCFAACKGGPIVCVQPDGTWYYNVTPENMDRIIGEHLRHTNLLSEESELRSRHSHPVLWGRAAVYTGVPQGCQPPEMAVGNRKIRAVLATVAVPPRMATAPLLTSLPSAESW